jgi:hypothetical protein
MRLASATFLVITSIAFAFAQNAPKSATVPITLDHNRIIIDVYLPLADGSKTRVRGWVDNGNDAMWITEDLAKKLNLPSTGDTQRQASGNVRMVQPPARLFIGEMPLRVQNIKEIRALGGRESVAPGTSAKISIPATVLRNYEILVDYPSREFTIALPGTLHFAGTATMALVNSSNGLIQIPATVGNQKQNLALDLGASVSLISDIALSGWLKDHPTWPHMIGAVGPANLWGLEDEPNWTVMRLPQVQYGNVKLTQVLAASFPGKSIDWFEKRAGVSTVGLIGADALLNYRVGLDYMHSTVYFDQTSKFNFPNMDVVGLILRPEADERYTIIGVADYQGKPSVPGVQKGDVLLTADGGRVTGATMGQVWSLLSGSPGSVKTLTIERGGKQLTVPAKVMPFLETQAAKGGPSSKAHNKPK